MPAAVHLARTFAPSSARAVANPKQQPGIDRAGELVDLAATIEPDRTAAASVINSHEHSDLERSRLHSGSSVVPTGGVVRFAGHPPVGGDGRFRTLFSKFARGSERPHTAKRNREREPSKLKYLW
jgi:hypothetical protein